MDDSFEKAAETYKFLDAAANTIKGRTWTISAWVLSASGAVPAFLVKQMQAQSVDIGFVIAGASAGLFLTTFAIVLVFDQASHLQSYWAQQDRARDFSQEFKSIIEHNQLGVNSRYYRPGPYTPMEAYTQSFATWYLEQIAAG